MSEKILLVDDDLETLRLVGVMLQRQGYQIVAANSGAQAITMAKSEMPDLILLDIMMPEMDGYEVARQLRDTAATVHIPILMFTAKTQVEDKITGYESGADDYLTKPAHPAELSAHIKALLGRTVKTRTQAATIERGYVTAVIAAKGGVGTSTIALNLGITLAQKLKLDVAAAEFRPGNGAWGLELGYPNPTGLHSLLQMKPADITRDQVQGELIANASGVRLLLSSYQPHDTEQISSGAHFETILDHLATVAPLTIVDLGNSPLNISEKILSLCNEVVVVLDPTPTSVAHTKALIDELTPRGFGKQKFLSVCLVNRTRAEVQLSWSQVQETLCQPIADIFTPMPELAYQSVLRYTPMVLFQTEGVHIQQYRKLADLVAQHAHKA